MKGYKSDDLDNNDDIENDIVSAEADANMIAMETNHDRNVPMNESMEPTEISNGIVTEPDDISFFPDAMQTMYAPDIPQNYCCCEIMETDSPEGTPSEIKNDESYPEPNCVDFLAINNCNASETELLNLQNSLQSKGLVVRKVKGDGACLFRAIALQAFGSEEVHFIIRQRSIDFIEVHREDFENFINGQESFENYVKRKRKSTTHGNHIEIQAMAWLFNRDVEIYNACLCKDFAPHIVPGKKDTDRPFRLFYNGYHFDAIVANDDNPEMSTPLYPTLLSEDANVRRKLRSTDRKRQNHFQTHDCNDPDEPPAKKPKHKNDIKNNVEPPIVTCRYCRNQDRPCSRHSPTYT